MAPSLAFAADLDGSFCSSSSSSLFIVKEKSLDGRPANPSAVLQRVSCPTFQSAQAVAQRCPSWSGARRIPPWFPALPHHRRCPPHAVLAPGPGSCHCRRCGRLLPPQLPSSPLLHALQVNTCFMQLGVVSGQKLYLTSKESLLHSVTPPPPPPLPHSTDALLLYLSVRQLLVISVTSQDAEG